jgi:transposase
MEHESYDFLPLRVIRVGPDGRRSYEPEGKRKLIAACRQPGASLSKLAGLADVKVKLLYNWLAQERVRSHEASERRFVPVLEIENDESCHRSAGFGNQPDTPIDNATVRQIRLQAQLRNGVSIELHCAATDRDLVVATINSLGAR